MTCTFVVLAGGLFSFTEPWNWAEGSWFSFVTASTVGFGDYVPYYGGGLVWVMQCTLIVMGISLWGLVLQIIASPDPDDEEQDTGKEKPPKIAAGVDAAGVEQSGGGKRKSHTLNPTNSKTGTGGSSKTDGGNNKRGGGREVALQMRKKGLLVVV
jgi:hypothetical protein